MLYSHANDDSLCICKDAEDHSVAEPQTGRSECKHCQIFMVLVADSVQST